MTKDKVLEFAKAAGLASIDVTSFDAFQENFQGNILKFLELATAEAKEEAFLQGQQNVLDSIA